MMSAVGIEFSIRGDHVSGRAMLVCERERHNIHDPFAVACCVQRIYRCRPRLLQFAILLLEKVSALKWLQMLDLLIFLL